MKELTIESIRLSMMNYQRVVILREKDADRYLPIWIGAAEAEAIAVRLQDVTVARPLTHDLLANVIEALGGRLERITINDLREHTFIATLSIRRDGELIEVDSRPSDAIALGAALGTPIFVAEHVLDAVLNEPASAKDRIELLKGRMQALREQIAEITERLADESFLAAAGEEVVEEHRRHLKEMQAEHDAIHRVLKKFL